MEINQEINGKREGYWETYHPNNLLYYRGNYKNGLASGYWEVYFTNGNLIWHGVYVNGEKSGLFKEGNMFDSSTFECFYF